MSTALRTRVVFWPSALLLCLSLGCVTTKSSQPPERVVAPAAPVASPQAATAGSPTPNSVGTGGSCFACEAELKLSEVEGGGDPIATLRALVHQLSTQPSSDAGRSAAQALCALAVGIEALGDPGPDAALINEVRRQATILAEVAGGAFVESGRLRSGLEAAERALEQVAERRGSRQAGAWLASANRAVGSVSATSLFALQRPAIQDAFRTITTSLAVLQAERAEAPRAARRARPEPRSPARRTTVTGQVADVESLPVSAPDANAYMRVATPAGEVLVQVAPVAYLADHPLPAEPGDAVEVQGERAPGGASTLVAHTIKGPRGTLLLRDSTGQALWRSTDD